MTQSLCTSIEEKLKISPKVAVRLYDGYTFYVTKLAADKQRVVGKFVPCAKNARLYEIPLSEILEVK